MQKVTRELYILNWKEYTLAEIDQLRNEFVYLSETVEKLSQEKVALEKSKKTLNEDIIKEKESFDAYKESENNRIIQEFDQREQKIKYDMLDIEQKRKELESLIKESIEIKKTVDEKTLLLISQERSLEKKHNDYMKLQESITKENENEKKHILLEREELLTIRNSTNEMIQENSRMIELFSKERAQREKDRIIYERDIEELKSIKKYTTESLVDLKNKESIILDKEKEINLSLKKLSIEEEKNKSEKEEIHRKELALIKKITDFQEEKHSFYLLMKRQGIKKSDIDELEKEFNS